LATVRLFGDLVVAAFLDGEKPNEREAKRGEYASSVVRGDAERYCDWLQKRRHSDPPLAPFHWEIEFPEGFGRHNPGFDAIVGNPPFAGKNSVAAANPDGYTEWLKVLHVESHGNADLVAHFYRRAFNLIRRDGAFGLIATKTIRQGDTRSSGLRWICRDGGEIFCARTRIKWPGLAAVVVSVLHVMKGVFSGQKRLDEREVGTISAFLFHRGGHDDPAGLAANEGKSFVGSYVLGMGFTFDDTDTNDVATPLIEMRRLLAKDTRNQEVIFPYIGGVEVNTCPTHAPHRYVINFGERSEEECRGRWPELMAIVETKVKPERMELADNPDGRRRKKHWWQFGRLTPALDAAIAKLDRVLAVPQTSNVQALAFLQTGTVFAHTIIVFPFTSYSAFAILQSRCHQIWSAFLGPNDCFETLPFPENWETHSTLEFAGKTYYEFRAALMIQSDAGLTKTYNRFHDPDERHPDILTLRELHADMDRAVLDDYGWTDIPTGCDFLLDYEIDEEEWGAKKKPWRYRWPDEVRDEVLARLLELNAQRAKEEVQTGAAAAKKKGKKAAPKYIPKQSDTGQDLFS
jgi:hypothetical protein